MKTYDRVSSLLCVALAFAICAESIRLGTGSLFNPGPGLIPLGCGLIFGIISLIVFALTFRGLPQAREAFWEPGAKKWSVVLSLVSMGGYAFLINFLGFPLVTFLWMFFVYRWLGGMGWKGTIFSSVVTSLSAYVLFETILEVHFPVGILGF